jgi:hypothetical protein
MTAAGFSRSASRQITFPGSPATIRALVWTLKFFQSKAHVSIPYEKLQTMEKETDNMYDFTNMNTAQEVVCMICIRKLLMALL